MALVSIVIPVYNRERYLGIAVQSVLDQTYQEWELIISDDGSTDGSLEIAQNFAAHDPRIRVLTNPSRPKNDKHRGAVNALIAGFDAARGEYIGQLDSDDLLEVGAIELTAEALDANPDWGMVYSNYVDIDKDGRKLRPGRRCAIPYSAERLLIDFMTFHFRLIRVSVYREIGGFNVKVDQVEDYDLCLRLSDVTQIEKINDYLYQYRIHPDSIKRTMNDFRRTNLCKKMISQALERRGMENTHEVIVTLNSTYRIQKTTNSDSNNS